MHPRLPTFVFVAGLFILFTARISLAAPTPNLTTPNGIDYPKPSEQKDTVQKRILGAGLGGGLPQLAGGEIFIYFTPRIQVGAGYGLAPNVGPFTPTIAESESTFTTVTGDSIRIWPRFHSRWAAITPYLRVYPLDTNFYLQFGASVFSTYIRFYSGISETGGNPIPDAYIEGQARVTQYLPTVSIGHLFVHGPVFYNFALGASFIVSSVDTGLTAKAHLPDALGGGEGNEGMLDGLKSQMNAAVKDAFTKNRDKLPFLPSIQISVGIFL